MATKKDAAPAAEKNELITVDPNRFAVGDVVDYGDSAGAGVDDIGMDETGVPFVKILQDDCKELKGGVVPEDALGNLFDTGTQEFSSELLLVPVCRQHVYNEWVPRKKGGGMVGTYSPDDQVVKAAIAASEEFGKYRTEAGNDLVENYLLFCIVLDPVTEEPTGFVVVPWSSSAIKVYRKRLMGRIRPVMVNGPSGKRRPPMFAHRIVLGTEIERKGDDEWFNYTVRFPVENNPRKSLMTAEHPGFQAGAELFDMVQGGSAKADMSTADTAAPDDDGGAAF